MSEKLFSPKYVSLYKECSHVDSSPTKKLSCRSGSFLLITTQISYLINDLKKRRHEGKGTWTKKRKSREGRIKQDNTIKATLEVIRVKCKGSVCSCVQTDLSL